MEQRILEGAVRALRRLNGAGYEAYLVGGCVRDLLRGTVPHDWDLCTSARPEQVTACFAGERVLPTGLKHGTVTVLLGQIPYEITTFRVDGAYSDGRRPDQVRFVARLEEDLARRDFTMNAIAMDAAGTVYDPFGGQADLHAGLVRCVGEPDRRFQEDGLRILRGLRFAAVLDFRLEEETARGILRERERLSCVAAERLQGEFTKLLAGPAAGRVLRAFGAVLCVFLPELEGAVSSPEWSRLAGAMDRAGPDPVVRLALLFCMAEKELDLTDLEQTLHRLCLDRETIRRVKELAGWCTVRLEPEEGAVRRLLGSLGPEGLERLLRLRWALDWDGAEQVRLDRVEALADTVLRRGDCCTLAELAVDGRDVIASGTAPGPEVGRTLALLLDQVLDGTLPNDRERLLRVLRERALEQSPGC